MEYEINLNNISLDNNFIISFEKFLLSFQKEDNIFRINRERNILDTKNLMIIGLYSPLINQIVKTITKDKEFLNYYLINYNSFKYYEEFIIYLKVLNNLKDIRLFKTYLFNNILFLESNLKNNLLDTWAISDTISYKYYYLDPSYYLNEIIDPLLNNKDLTNQNFIITRSGLKLLFPLINDKKSKEKIDINQVFKYINLTINLSNYYIKMMIAWLLATIYLFYKEEVINNYLKNEKVDDFIINMTISKINDSYRVSKFDKEELKKFRRKNEKK